MAGITRTPATDGAIDTMVMLADTRVRDTAGHTAVVTVEGMLEAATMAGKASTLDMAADVANRGQQKVNGWQRGLPASIFTANSIAQPAIARPAPGLSVDLSRPGRTSARPRCVPEAEIRS